MGSKKRNSGWKRSGYFWQFFAKVDISMHTRILAERIYYNKNGHPEIQKLWSRSDNLEEKFNINKFMTT